MVSPKLRSAVVDLVREAGRATMTYYDAPEALGVREKDDKSPVTLADEVAHGILVEGLRQLDPSTPVVSEEAAADEDSESPFSPSSPSAAAEAADGEAEKTDDNPPST